MAVMPYLESTVLSFDPETGLGEIRNGASKPLHFELGAGGRPVWRDGFVIGSKGHSCPRVPQAEDTIFYSGQTYLKNGREYVRAWTMKVVPSSRHAPLGEPSKTPPPAVRRPFMGRHRAPIRAA